MYLKFSSCILLVYPLLIEFPLNPDQFKYYINGGLEFNVVTSSLF